MFFGVVLNQEVDTFIPLSFYEIGMHGRKVEFLWLALHMQIIQCWPKRTLDLDWYRIEGEIAYLKANVPKILQEAPQQNYTLSFGKLPC